MTIREFIDRYDMHDSVIESVSYDAAQERLILIVHFCFWMQEGFVKGSKENGPISIVFDRASNVTFNPTPEYTGAIILKTVEKEGLLTISLYEDIDNNYYEISLEAEDVIVTEL